MCFVVADEEKRKRGNNTAVCSRFYRHFILKIPILNKGISSKCSFCELRVLVQYGRTMVEKVQSSFFVPLTGEQRGLVCSSISMLTMGLLFTNGRFCGEGGFEQWWVVFHKG